MRWIVCASIVITLAWLGFAASPLLAVYDLASAVQRRDIPAINARVNFPAVGQSLATQIALTYLQLTGRDARLGPRGRELTVAAVGTVADPVVRQLVTSDALAALLRDGWPTTVIPERPAATQGLTPGTLGSLWQLYAQSSLGLRRFNVTVPTAAPPEQQLKLRFRLTSWTWRLNGVELPQALRVRLAQEVIKQIDRK